MNSVVTSHVIDLFAKLVTILIVVNLNQNIKDFFLNNFVIFVVFAFCIYDKDHDLVRALVGSFLITVVVGVLMMDDPFNSMNEAFGMLISPTSDSIAGCNNVKAADLISKFGSKEKVIDIMETIGVPYDLPLSDDNAPIIATYIANNKNYSSITADCHWP